MKYLPIITFALTVVDFVCLFDNKSKNEEDFDEVKQVHNEDNENIIKNINSLLKFICVFLLLFT